MAEVVLFHHAQGLTPGVVAFAHGLRSGGHTVYTPDLFDGRTFGSIDEGMAHAQEIGFPDAVITRGARAVAGLPAELVYAGFSLAYSRPSSWRRPGPGRGGRCCVTPASRSRRSAPHGPPMSRCSQRHGS